MRSIKPYKISLGACKSCGGKTNSSFFCGCRYVPDFLSTIEVQKSLVKKVEKTLFSKRWVAKPITITGDVDCYNAREKELQLTKRLLQLFWRFRHPVIITTRSSLIFKDISLLKKMAARQLIKVIVPVCSLDEELNRILEPNSIGSKERFETIQKLTLYRIPVAVQLHPIIPGLNDCEVFNLIKKAADLGAKEALYAPIPVSQLRSDDFSQWLQEHFSTQEEQVQQAVKAYTKERSNILECVDKQKSLSSISTLRRQFYIANRRYLSSRSIPPFNTSLHYQHKTPQLKLF